MTGHNKTLRHVKVDHTDLDSENALCEIPQSARARKSFPLLRFGPTVCQGVTDSGGYTVALYH
jgi:hypothetical protein